MSGERVPPIAYLLPLTAYRSPLPGVAVRAVYGIVVREFVRFARQRGRALSSIARPFIWLIFAGAGFATVFAGGGEIDYRRRIGATSSIRSTPASRSVTVESEASSEPNITTIPSSPGAM